MRLIRVERVCIKHSSADRGKVAERLAENSRGRQPTGSIVKKAPPAPKGRPRIWTTRSTGVAILTMTWLLISTVLAQTPWPTDHWSVSTPAQQEMDAAPLRALVRDIESGNYGYVDQVLVVRNGYAVLNETWRHDYTRISQGRDLTRHHYNYYHPDFHPFWEGSGLHSLQSVTKSVNSALIGIALAKGRLPGLEVKVLPYFSDYKIQRMDDRKRRMTLLNLVTMRAGLYWNVVDYPLPDPRNTTIQLESSENWIQFCLDQPMDSEPGEVFVYSSGAAQLLSGLIKQATGLHVPEYAEAHLFNPIGIHRYHWKRDPESFADTEGGLYLTAEDLARFGYLFLRGGIWDGKRILAEGWVAESTARKTEDVAPGDPEQNRGYGYQWWRLEEPGDTPVIAGLGYGGQYLVIIPERDLVAVMTGWNIFEPYPSALTPFLQALLSSTTP